MHITKHLKSSLLRQLALPGVAGLLARSLRGHVAVFMLHRIHDAERGIEGSDREALRTTLAHLKRSGFKFVSLEDALRHVRGEGPPLHRAVAFTLDDGYADQARVAAPVFAEFECPATIFVTTGFLDRKFWNWWDQIEYVFRHSEHSQVNMSVVGNEIEYTWQSGVGRREAQLSFTEVCKRARHAEKIAAIDQLAAAADVELPESPPPEYEPMSWDELKACERIGISFGPHTVTHPILSLVSDEQSRSEITVSWHRLQEEAINPVPIFCYPNGQDDDFGEREFAVLAELEFDAAVSGLPGYLGPGLLTGPPMDWYCLPRFGLSDELPRVIQSAAGVERMKDWWRRML